MQISKHNMQINNNSCQKNKHHVAICRLQVYSLCHIGHDIPLNSIWIAISNKHVLRVN